MSNQPPKVWTGIVILSKLLLDVERLPVVVVVGVGQPVVVEARVAPHELLHRVQGQVLLHLGRSESRGARRPCEALGSA